MLQITHVKTGTVLEAMEIENVRANGTLPLMPGEPLRLILLFEGRTGSSYLWDLLNCHPEIELRGERLGALIPRNIIDPQEQLNWVREMLNERPPGKKVVGFKTKLHPFAEPQRLAQLLGELQPLVIHMSRRNVIKAVVSEFTGEQLFQEQRVWNSPKPPGNLCRIDCARFEKQLQRRLKAEETLRGFVAALNLPLIRISYEELLQKPDEVVNTFFKLFDLPPAQTKTNLAKITPDNLRQAVVNFDELRACYTGTEFEPMFDEAPSNT